MVRKRFRFQYSLKALFVVTFIFGPLLGTYIYRVRQRPKDAQRAIARLEAKECRVTFNLQEPTDADFMSKWVGADPLPVHCDVIAGNRKLSDDEVEHLGALTDFDALHLDGIKVGDRSWSFFRRVKRIRKLILDETNLTDTGLLHLSSVSGIEFLSLEETAVTDRGAAILGKRTDVKYLFLAKTKITDAGLAEIGKMKQLIYLDLTDCAITNEGIGHLVNLANLEEIVLSGTGLTDEGLAHFVPMKKLHMVEVYRCTITVEAARSLFFSREDNPIVLMRDQQ